MKNLKKKRRVQIVSIAFVALAVATILIGFAMKDGINFFKSPTQVIEVTPNPNEVFRIGGLVEEGTLLRGVGETISFYVTDGNESVSVKFTGLLPDLFEENQGMVATGKYIDGIFYASEILAKHDETYMPSEVIDALKEQGVYQEPD
ncbi:cytochrome c maturation protein CcmE [bacterium]|jgi:cytochrome c-type biogenesis protein CcmE|nr:cytochrome c maturation protein CcmE [Marinovum sp.]MDA9671256.1 cytochrome c maturation protein CcmE [bacterium]MDG2429820.1 cytochrome c maturation protein CcmE [Paracoccaceae bacterium]|tara:strand:- start:1713 stop:2153 length:441 start_codon:yes stop_codon:yes gene_type:complete